MSLQPAKAGSSRDMLVDGGSPERKKVRMAEDVLEEGSNEDGEDEENDEREATPEVQQDRSTQTAGSTVKEKTNLFKNQLYTQSVPRRDDLTMEVMTTNFVRNKQFDAALETLEGRQDSDSVWFRARILKMADHYYQSHPSEAPTDPNSQSSVLSRSHGDEGPTLPEIDAEVMAERLVRDFALMHKFELKSEVEKNSKRRKKPSHERPHSEMEMADPDRPLSSLSGDYGSTIGSTRDGTRDGSPTSAQRNETPSNIHHLPWVESASTLGSEASFDLAAGVRRNRTPTCGVQQDSWEGAGHRAGYGSCRSFATTPSRLNSKKKTPPQTVSNLGVRNLNSPHFKEVQRAIFEATRRAEEESQGGKEPEPRTVNPVAPSKSSVRIAREEAHAAAEKWQQEQKREAERSRQKPMLPRFMTRVGMGTSKAALQPDPDSPGGPSPMRGSPGNMSPMSASPVPTSGNASPTRMNRMSRSLSIHRRKSQEDVMKAAGEAAEKGERKGETLSPRMAEEVRTASEQWEHCRDIRALPMDEVSKMRKDASAQAQASVKEAMGPGKEGLHKMSRGIKKAVKTDEIGKTLQEEENETHNMLATLTSIEEMLTKLTVIRSERQKKKVHEHEMIVKQGQEELDRASKRHERDFTHAQSTADASAAKRKELGLLRDKLEKSEEDIKALETQVDLLRNQVANAEGKALVSSSQGLMNVAREAEAKANRLRKEYQSVRERVAVKSKDCVEVRKAVESCTYEANDCDMVAQKDDYRAGESKKAYEKERKKLEEMKSKLAAEKKYAHELAEKSSEQEQSTQRARDLNAEQGHTISGLLVTDRLRAKSLSVIAKNLVTTMDVPKDKLVKEPVFVGKKQDGLRHGFGCIEYPEGAEFRGQWANDQPEGSGAERYSDGSTYVGSYKAGMRHGLGSFTLVSGVGYLGSWKGGRRDGYGIIAVKKKGSSAILPVFLCHTTAGKHLTVSKFKTDLAQHLVLLSDCLMAVDAAQKQARAAQTQAFSEYFNRNEDAQNKRLEEMGVGVKGQNPLFKAFEQSEKYRKAKESVVTKTRDFIRLSKVLNSLGGFSTGQEKQNLAAKIFTKKKPEPKTKLATVSKTIGLLAALNTHKAPRPSPEAGS